VEFTWTRSFTGSQTEAAANKEELCTPYSVENIGDASPTMQSLQSLKDAVKTESRQSLKDPVKFKPCHCRKDGVKFESRQSLKDAVVIKSRPSLKDDMKIESHQSVKDGAKNGAETGPETGAGGGAKSQESSIICTRYSLPVTTDDVARDSDDSVTQSLFISGLIQGEFRDQGDNVENLYY
jgi:hypothetical protein